MKSNLVDILQEHGIRQAPEDHHHSRYGWAQFDCPFCGRGTKKYHLGYSLQNDYFNCWQCGHKSVSAVVQAFLQLSYQDVTKLLEGVTVTRTERKEKPTGVYRAPHGLGPPQLAHIQYLKKRGFNPEEIISLWGLRGTDWKSNDIPWRLFIPIVHRGNTVSWTSRAIGKDVRPKYYSAAEVNENIPHKSLLYGMDFVRDTCIVVEGPTDVWNIGPGAVGTFGLSYCPAQVSAISKVPNRYIAFDNSIQAQKVARKLSRDLSIFTGNTYLMEIDADDPGSASRSEVQKVREFCFGKGE